MENDSKKNPPLQPPTVLGGDLVAQLVADTQQNFTTNETAKLFKVTKQAVEKWRKNGQLAADSVDKNGVYWYSKETLIKFAADRFANQFPPPISPTEYHGKHFYTAQKVAKIVGVDKTTVEYWRNQNLFKEDLVTHDGKYLYEIERVNQLKSVYRRDWQSAYRKYDDDINEKLIEPPQVAPTVKFIPSEVLSQILAISPDEFVARGILQIANDGKSYTCLFCDNGSGKNGTGIKPNFSANVWTWHCFKCGKAFNNISILALYYNLDSRSNFIEICRRACDDFGILLDIPQEDSQMKDSQIDKILLIKSDISTKNGDFLDDLSADARRGLSIETLRHFHCKYIINWLPVYARISGFKQTPTPRLIIPSGEHYLARLTVPLENFAHVPDRKFIKDKPHEGHKSLFGIDFISSDTKFIIVTEGEIDAMSIHQSLKSDSIISVATSGAAEKKWVNLLANKCSELNLKPFVIVLFDNDDAGKSNAPQRTAELIARNIPAVFSFLSEGDKKIDANDILLQPNGELLLKELISDIITSQTDSLNQILVDIDNSKNLLDNQIIFSAEQYNYIFRVLQGNSDLANARRMAYLWHNNIRYISDTDHWAWYDAKNGIWIINPNSKNSALNHFVHKTADTLILNAKTSADSKIANSFNNQRKYLPAVSTLKGDKLLTIKNEDFNHRELIVTNHGGKLIAVTPDDINKHKHLLNCENGVVDLQTGKLYEHSPHYNWTQFVRAEYRAGYSNEIVDTFLRQIQPNEQTRAALLRFFGYAITGESREEKFLFMTGRGGNGKGTLTKLFLYIMNNYGCSFPVEGILVNSRIDANAATTAFNMLIDKRVSITEEIPDGSILNVAKIKLLSGGDSIPIRLLHQEYSTIEDPLFTMIFSGNSLPEVPNIHDIGFLRRLVNIIFAQDFTHNPDLKLKEKLMTPDSRAAFISLLVQNAILWYKEGLIVSSEMQQARQDYIHSQDFIGAFIDEHCKYGTNLSISRKEFLKALQESYPKETRGLSDRSLTSMIEKIDGILYERGGKNHIGHFLGIGWNDSFEQCNFEEEFFVPPDIK